MKSGRITERKEYKVVISDLGESPFRVLRLAFILMGIIPLLVIFYIVIGRHFLYRIFLGDDGLIAVFAIIISLVGFLYAYNLTKNMVIKLLAYSAARKRADNEKTELLLAISHDLKAPLGVLRMGLNEFVDAVGANLNAIQSRMVKYCLNAAEKIANFVNELLEVSKTTYVRTDGRREKIDFGILVKKEIDDIANLASGKKQDIDFQNTAGGATILADEGKLGRAVMNIIVNAVKYTPEGDKIRVIVSSDDTNVKLSVVNTGHGISAEAIDRVFNKFERFNKDAKIDGVGLGLYIVREIIDLHNGRITVRSEPDKETEVTITLPR